ncbi:hypothetical protein DSM21852_14910 [Methylocystis bryophila]|uniref:Ricin B lectin domain-containing protein n=2 Tax=Methylocystis bryophila TaxID=655015 RepID=A0A1W6MX68_9HYPH|nr:hypothetical protein B1812_14635 [Methylocystis bryophila]BDV38238.1 hypothetical protein DSM21852_14910 [Methylocystis bryophila]
MCADFTELAMKIRLWLLACAAAWAMILIAAPLPARANCPIDQGLRTCGDTCIALSQCCNDQDCFQGQFCDGLRACNPSFGTRPLINVGSGKCFAPTPPQGGDIGWAGVPIQQRTCASTSNEQSYTIEPLGFMNPGCPGWWCPGCICVPDTEGFFIRNKATGLCLDARDGAKNDGSVVQQWTCRDKNAHSMVWTIERGDFSGADWRSIKLRNFNSGLCLDVRSGSSDEFAQLQQYHCTSNNAAQNFRQGAP